MGTNYYLKKEVCGHCGRGDGPLHIGKSSMGWVFSLHVDPENGIKDLPDWEPLLRDPKNRIEDEYGKTVTADEMLDVIKNRKGKVTLESDGVREMLAKGQTIIDPAYGLLRSNPHARYSHVSANGAGTWDICPGEFS